MSRLQRERQSRCLRDSLTHRRKTTSQVRIKAWRTSPARRSLSFSRRWIQPLVARALFSSRPFSSGTVDSGSSGSSGCFGSDLASSLRVFPLLASNRLCSSNSFQTFFFLLFNRLCIDVDEDRFRAEAIASSAEVHVFSKQFATGGFQLLHGPWSWRDHDECSHALQMKAWIRRSSWFWLFGCVRSFCRFLIRFRVRLGYYQSAGTHLKLRQTSSLLQQKQTRSR